MQAEAEQRDEAMKMAQMRQLLSAGTSLAGTLGSAMQQQKTDSIANALMNEATPPRAEAVDPALNAAMEAQGMGATNPATGGVTEMKLRQAMEDQKMQKMQLALRAEQEQRLSAMANQQQTLRQQEEASKAFQQSSKGMQESFNDSMAYYKTVGVGMKQAAEATTPVEHEAAATGVISMYQAAKKRGLDVEAPKIPVFMTPEQKAEIAAQQAELEAARSRLSGMKSDMWPNWIGGDEKQAAIVRELEGKVSSQPKPGYLPIPEVVPVAPVRGSIAQLSAQTDADLSLPLPDADVIPETTGEGGYITGRRYGGKTYLGGDPNSPSSWK